MMMRRKVFLFSLSLLAMMLFLPACSSEEKLSTCHCEKNLVKTVEQVSGTMRYEDRLGKWYIEHGIPFSIDAVDDYFPDKLDKKFKQEGMKVLVSGDVYEMNIEWHGDNLIDIGGLERYCMDILSIEEYDENYMDPEALKLICQTWKLQGYGSEANWHDVGTKNEGDHFEITFSPDGTFSSRAIVNETKGKFVIGKYNNLRFSDDYQVNHESESDADAQFMEYVLPQTGGKTVLTSDELKIYYDMNSYFYFKKKAQI